MRRPIRPFLLAVAVLAAFAAVVSACGSSSSSSDTLTLYSGRNEDLVKGILDQFTDPTLGPTLCALPWIVPEGGPDLHGVPLPCLSSDVTVIS